MNRLTKQISENNREHHDQQVTFSVVASKLRILRQNRASRDWLNLRTCVFVSLCFSCASLCQRRENLSACAASALRASRPPPPPRLARQRTRGRGLAKFGKMALRGNSAFAEAYILLKHAYIRGGPVRPSGLDDQLTY